MIPDKNMKNVITPIEKFEKLANPSTCVMKPPVDTVLKAVQYESTKPLPLKNNSKNIATVSDT